MKELTIHFKVQSIKTKITETIDLKLTIEKFINRFFQSQRKDRKQFAWSVLAFLQADYPDYKLTGMTYTYKKSDTIEEHQTKEHAK